MRDRRSVEMGETTTMKPSKRNRWTLRPLIIAAACLTLATGCEPYATGPGENELPPGPGRDLFLGQGGCHLCHGRTAQGSSIAPNLTDDVWLNGDGSLEFIRETIDNGVPDPVQFPAPMPPRGGANLTDEQVDILAHFVFTISR